MYNGSEVGPVSYTIIIDGNGTPDTFRWQKGSGTFTTGVAITGSSQNLSNGVTIRFTATTGHTLNDQWVIIVTPVSAFGVQNPAGTRIFHVGNDGNIGIGTTSPTSLLEVSASVNNSSSSTLLVSPSLSITNRNTANNSFGTLAFRSQDSSGNASSTVQLLGIGTSHTSNRLSGDFAIQTLNAGSSTEKLRITAGGNIGIGSSTPWRTLSISGTVGFDGLTGSIGAGSLCLTANKEVVYNSGSDNCLSSIRSTKHDITPLTADAFAQIASLQSVSFIYNDDASSTIRYGFIAEDTANVDSHLATYNQAGALSGVDDRALLSIIVKALQDLIDRVGDFAEKLITKEIVAKNIESDVITAKQKLCVGSTCLTEAQIQTLLQNAGMNSSSPPPQNIAQNSSGNPSSGDGATTTVSDAPPLVPDAPANAGQAALNSETTPSATSTN